VRAPFSERDRWKEAGEGKTEPIESTKKLKLKQKKKGELQNKAWSTHLILHRFSIQRQNGARLRREEHFNISTHGELRLHDDPGRRWRRNSNICQLSRTWLRQIGNHPNLKVSRYHCDSIAPDFALQNQMFFAVLSK
jgi:hypothetical protein